MLQYPSLQLKIHLGISNLFLIHLAMYVLIILSIIDYFHKKKNKIVLSSAFVNVKLGILEVTVVFICSLTS